MIDEQQVSEALKALDADVAPDLVDRVRRGGQRRLVRRRTFAAAGAVAVAGVAAPVTVAAWPASGDATVTPGSSQDLAGLYATPPAAGSQCNSGYTAKTAANGEGLAAAYPQLLLLPAGQAVTYAFVRRDRANCIPPHVALTAAQRDGERVTRGLVVEGPNAPTAEEDGRQGPGISFGGETGHAAIDGQQATEFTIAQNGHTDAYWTEPDGGQWHAEVVGMTQADAVTMLNQLRLDSHEGTASIPGAAADGWTAVPTPADAGQVHGWFTAQWKDAQGHVVDLDVSQAPDQVDQLAAMHAGSATYTTVRSHPALYAAAGGLGGGVPDLIWQEAPGVQVDLTITGASETEVKQVAASLALASPTDSRITIG